VFSGLTAVYAASRFQGQRILKAAGGRKALYSRGRVTVMVGTYWLPLLRLGRPLTIEQALSCNADATFFVPELQHFIDMLGRFQAFCREPVDQIIKPEPLK